MQLVYNIWNVIGDAGLWIALTVVGGIAMQARREVRALRRALHMTPEDVAANERERVNAAMLRADDAIRGWGHDNAKDEAAIKRVRENVMREVRDGR